MKNRLCKSEIWQGSHLAIKLKFIRDIYLEISTWLPVISYFVVKTSLRLRSIGFVKYIINSRIYFKPFKFTATWRIGSIDIANCVAWYLDILSSPAEMVFFDAK